MSENGTAKANCIGVKEGIYMRITEGILNPNLKKNCEKPTWTFLIGIAKRIAIRIAKGFPI